MKELKAKAETAILKKDVEDFHELKRKEYLKFLSYSDSKSLLKHLEEDTKNTKKGILVVLKDTTTNDVIGGARLLALKSSVVKKFEKGSYTEFQVGNSDLITIVGPSAYDLFIDSVVIKDEYKLPTVITALTCALAEKIYALNSSKFNLKSVFSTPFNELGRAICGRMDFKEKSVGANCIYYLDLVDRTKGLTKFYDILNYSK